MSDNSFPTAIMAIGQNASDFDGEHLREFSQFSMFDMLYSEVEELEGAIKGGHDDHPAYELIQIGGIVVNMLKRYPKSVIMAELEKIRERHRITEQVTPQEEGE